MSTQPNILFLVSDQERPRDWLRTDVARARRQRRLDGGLEFCRHSTHSYRRIDAAAAAFGASR